jgi:hypothetical protein
MIEAAVYAAARQAGLFLLAAFAAGIAIGLILWAFVL